MSFFQKVTTITHHIGSCCDFELVIIITRQVTRATLRFGLPRFRFPSTVICNIFLVASSLSHLCTCPNHRVHGCLFPGVYISHMYDLVLSFLFTTAACIFQLSAIMTIILQNCNTAKGVSQHNNNILVCLFQTHKIGTAYIIMSVRRPTHRNTKFQYKTINLTYCTQEW